MSGCFCDFFRGDTGGFNDLVVLPCLYYVGLLHVVTGCGVRPGGRGSTECRALLDRRAGSHLHSRVVHLVMAREGCGSPRCGSGGLTRSLDAGSHCVSTIYTAQFRGGCSRLIGSCHIGSTVSLLASGHCTGVDIRSVDRVTKFDAHRDFCTGFCGHLNVAPHRCHLRRSRRGWLHLVRTVPLVWG